MSKTVLITQSNYIPWKGYFDAINQADEFILLDNVQYTRRDWRNRNKIVTPNGLQWLTIPVSVKGKFNQTINETTVVGEQWRVKHWNSIRTNYGKAPFFGLYSEIFEQIYLKDCELYLSRINEAFITAINGILGIDTKISRCEHYGLVEGKSERLIDLCLKSGASDYLTGPAAKVYLDLRQFEAAGITVHWLDYKAYPEYPQCYGGFEHGVTVLDLLFNTGPKAQKFLKSFRTTRCSFPS